MSIVWSDLTIVQRRLLMRLARADEGFAHHDAVGLPVDAIPSGLLPAGGSLCWLELVEEHLGWGDRSWLRLTEVGRQVEAAE